MSQTDHVIVPRASNHNLALPHSPNPGIGGILARKAAMRHLALYRRDEMKDWNDFFNLERPRLAHAAASFLCHGACIDAVLQQVEERARHVCVSGAFKHRYAQRALVQAVIEHLRACDRECGRIDPLARAQEAGLPIKALPIFERIAFFLAEVLACSRTEIALLMNLREAQVDILLRAAIDRLPSLGGPSFLGWQFRIRPNPDWPGRLVASDTLLTPRPTATHMFTVNPLI